MNIFNFFGLDYETPGQRDLVKNSVCGRNNRNLWTYNSRD